MSTSKPHILFLNREFTCGGASFYAIRVMKELLPQYQIDLLIVGRSDKETLEELPKEIRVKVEKISVLDRFYGLLGLKKLHASSLFKRMQAGPFLQPHYDAVLAISMFPDMHTEAIYFQIHSQLKIVFLVDERLAKYSNLSSNEQARIEEGLAVTDHVISVSDSLYQSLSKQCKPLQKKSFSVLRPFVSDQFIPAAPYGGARDSIRNAKPVVLTVARLVRGKNILKCLQIHHALKSEGIDFIWNVIGQGRQYKNLSAEIKRLGMQDNFILAGFQKNVWSWIEKSDISALFSVSEGCPTAIIEAMYMQCPVISTDVHGIKSLIQHEINGLIVANNIDEIKEQLKKLIKSTDLRNKFRQHLHDWPIPPVDLAGMAMLQSIINNSSKRISADLQVSILIPTFNQKDWINRAIESALMQNFHSFEVIVMDDSSDDGTENIVSKWHNDQRFRYVRNQKNLGRAGNYKKGLCEVARGKWIVMLDGDDFLTNPDYLKKSWEITQTHKSEPIMFVQFGHQVKNSEKLGNDFLVLPRIKNKTLLLNGKDYIDFVYKTGFFSHLGIFFNREHALQNNCYDTEISSADLLSFLRLSLEGKVILYKEIAGCWFKHAGNTSSNLPASKIFENTVIFRKIANMAVKKGLASKYKFNLPLLHYEARTFSHLYKNSLKNSSFESTGIMKIYRTIFEINPILFFHFRIINIIITNLISALKLKIKSFYNN